MGGNLRLGDLERPLQDDLGKDTHKKEWPCKKILKKKKGNSCERKVCYWKRKKASVAGYWWEEGREASREEVDAWQGFHQAKPHRPWWGVGICMGKPLNGSKWVSKIIWSCFAKINQRADKKAKCLQEHKQSWKTGQRKINYIMNKEMLMWSLYDELP